MSGEGEPILWTREYAAKKCSVSLDTIRRGIGNGTLRAKRTGENGGGKYLTDEEACREWFRNLPDA